MIGIMANAARHEPEAVAALRAGREDRVNRLLRLPLPEPYVPTRTEALRDRLRSRPRHDRPSPHASRTRKPDRKPAANKKRKPPSGRPAGAALRASWRRPQNRHSGRRAPHMEGQRYG